MEQSLDNPLVVVVIIIGWCCCGMDRSTGSDMSVSSSFMAVVVVSSGLSCVIVIVMFGLTVCRSCGSRPERHEITA